MKGVRPPYCAQMGTTPRFTRLDGRSSRLGWMCSIEVAPWETQYLLAKTASIQFHSEEPKIEWLQILFSKRQFQIFTPSKFKNSIQPQLHLFQALYQQELKYPTTQSFASPCILKKSDQQSELRLWSLELDQVNSRSKQANDPQSLWRSRRIVKETGR